MALVQTVAPIRTTSTDTTTSSRTVTETEHQPHMSFAMGGFGPPSGAYPMPPNGYVAMSAPIIHQQYPPSQRPSIYTAVYSGISVYEMEINRIIVMRRREDSWLNATQILKVAGVDKGKRTKVLEKEILSGEHEKVQGGYGKYQGTWVNYGRGREFCRQYGVEELLRPLLEYDMGQDGVSIAGQGSIETPTKEQAMAAQRKKMMYNGGAENRPQAQSPNGTFFKNISASAANAVQAINKARFDSPGPRPGSGNKRPAPVRRRSQQALGSQDAQHLPGSQQSVQSIQTLHSDGSFGINGQLEPAFGTQSTPYFIQPKRSRSGIDEQEPPRKRIRPASSQGTFSQGVSGPARPLPKSVPAEANQPLFYNRASSPPMDHAVVALQPLPQPSSASALEKQQLLISLFLDPAQTDFSVHSAFDTLVGEDPDIPMDPTAHTALHWAATLARVPLLRSLIARGASIFRVNGGGETALMRAAATTNNLDQNSFQDLLDLLGPTIEMRDGRGRTILHHIAISSAIKGKSAACRYYLESLLEFVVRQGSAPNSHPSSFRGSDGVSKPKRIGLARFMSEIVNAQDMSGDTALNMAARSGNKSIIQQLLEVGANPAIPNRGGLKPTDFGVGGEMEASEGREPSSQTPSGSQKSKVADTSRELMSSITTLLADTEMSISAELRSKQSLIDQAHAKLKEQTALLNDERRRLADMQRRFDAGKDLQQQIAVLRRSNEAQKSQLLASGKQPRPNVAIGDADAGLLIDASLLPAPGPGPGPGPPLLSAEQAAYLDSLPPSDILDARASAYRANNEKLAEKRAQLAGRGLVLERKLTRVVALSSGIDDAKVRSMLGGLLTAVESEGGEEVEMGRVREFLRRVEDEAE